MASRFAIDAVFRAIDKVSAPVNRMQARVGRFTRGVNRGFRTMNRNVDKVNASLKGFATTAATAGAVAVTTLTAAIVGLVGQASKIENAVASFTPLLGGADKAREAVDKLNATAASTPFQFEQLANSANTLLGFGVATLDDLVPTLRMLGDTAGGSADKLNGITLAFSQIKAGGKANMQDINQLINNGIPILGELADMWGVNVGRAREMVSQGRATGAEVEKAFKKMTSAGGKFFKGMELASATQTGLLSTLKDNISLAAAAIGEALLPQTKELTKTAIDAAGSVRKWAEENKELISQKIGQAIKFLTENADNFLKVAKGLVQILGAWLAITITLKVATFAFNVVLFASKVATIGWAVAVKAATAVGFILSGLLKVLRFGMLAFNLAMAANPIGLLIAGIGLLIAAGVALIMNWDKVTAFMSSVWDNIKTAASDGVDFLLSVLDKVMTPFKLIKEGISAIASGASSIFGGAVEVNANQVASAQGQAQTRQVVSAADQTAKSIEERRSTSTAEVTIRDETGRAEMKQQGNATGASVRLEASGAF